MCSRKNLHARVRVVRVARAQNIRALRTRAQNVVSPFRRQPPCQERITLVSHRFDEADEVGRPSE